MSLWNKAGQEAERRRHRELCEAQVRQIDAALRQLRVLDALRQTEGGRALFGALDRHYTAAAAEAESSLDSAALMKLAGIMNGLARARALLRDQTDQIEMLVEERARVVEEMGEE